MEQLVDIEAAVRTPGPLRRNYGSLTALATSIRDEGMRHPLVLWKDGTLISGARRHRACLLLARPIQAAVFVHTIEDAAKHLLGDNEDDYLALPWKISEMCRLWELLRRLDEPAAILRGDAARRRGVELRRQTQGGKRKPGRNPDHAADYQLSVLCGPFGMSATTAKRVWAIYSLAYGGAGDVYASDERRQLAREVMQLVDAGESSIYAGYSRLTVDRGPAPRLKARPTEVLEPAAARTQLAAWDRSLPQLEGMVAGLVELGPPNPALTWDQVSPVYTRLMYARRELEKIINKMREISKS